MGAIQPGNVSGQCWGALFMGGGCYYAQKRGSEMPYRLTHLAMGKPSGEGVQDYRKLPGREGLKDGPALLSTHLG